MDWTRWNAIAADPKQEFLSQAEIRAYIEKSGLWRAIATVEAEKAAVKKKTAEDLEAAAKAADEAEKKTVNWRVSNFT